MKLCVDCKHYKLDKGHDGGMWNYSFPDRHYCMRFSSPVTGKTEYHHCAPKRERKGGCGPEGFFWEAK
jgi:hypothetical protein